MAEPSVNGWHFPVSVFTSWGLHPFFEIAIQGPWGLHRGLSIRSILHRKARSVCDVRFSKRRQLSPEGARKTYAKFCPSVLQAGSSSSSADRESRYSSTPSSVLTTRVSALVSPVTNAIRVPSGLHEGIRWQMPKGVSRRVFPVSQSTSPMASNPWWSQAPNAMVFPSGERAGREGVHVSLAKIRRAL